MGDVVASVDVLADQLAERPVGVDPETVAVQWHMDLPAERLGESMGELQGHRHGDGHTFGGKQPTFAFWLVGGLVPQDGNDVATGDRGRDSSIDDRLDAVTASAQQVIDGVGAARYEPVPGHL